MVHKRVVGLPVKYVGEQHPDLLDLTGKVVSVMGVGLVRVEFEFVDGHHTFVNVPTGDVTVSNGKHQ